MKRKPGDDANDESIVISYKCDMHVMFLFLYMLYHMVWPPLSHVSDIVAVRTLALTCGVLPTSPLIAECDTRMLSMGKSADLLLWLATIDPLVSTLTSQPTNQEGYIFPHFYVHDSIC
jgi:hypothetical protein